jgi:hypothetical protein
LLRLRFGITVTDKVSNIRDHVRIGLQNKAQVALLHDPVLIQRSLVSVVVPFTGNKWLGGMLDVALVLCRECPDEVVPETVMQPSVLGHVFQTNTGLDK